MEEADLGKCVPPATSATSETPTRKRRWFGVVSDAVTTMAGAITSPSKKQRTSDGETISYEAALQTLESFGDSKEAFLAKVQSGFDPTELAKQCAKVGNTHDEHIAALENRLEMAENLVQTERGLLQTARGKKATWEERLPWMKEAVDLWKRLTESRKGTARLPSQAKTTPAPAAGNNEEWRAFLRGLADKELDAVMWHLIDPEKMPLDRTFAKASTALKFDTFRNQLDTDQIRKDIDQESARRETPQEVAVLDNAVSSAGSSTDPRLKQGSYPPSGPPPPALPAQLATNPLHNVQTPARVYPTQPNASSEVVIVIDSTQPASSFPPHAQPASHQGVGGPAVGASFVSQGSVPPALPQGGSAAADPGASAVPQGGSASPGNAGVAGEVGVQQQAQSLEEVQAKLAVAGIHLSLDDVKLMILKNSAPAPQGVSGLAVDASVVSPVSVHAPQVVGGPAVSMYVAPQAPAPVHQVIGGPAVGGSGGVPVVQAVSLNGQSLLDVPMAFSAHVVEDNPGHGGANVPNSTGISVSIVDAPAEKAKTKGKQTAHKAAEVQKPETAEVQKPETMAVKHKDILVSFAKFLMENKGTFTKCGLLVQEWGAFEDNVKMDAAIASLVKTMEKHLSKDKLYDGVDDEVECVDRHKDKTKVPNRLFFMGRVLRMVFSYTLKPRKMAVFNECLTPLYPNSVRQLAGMPVGVQKGGDLDIKGTVPNNVQKAWGETELMLNSFLTSLELKASDFFPDERDIEGQSSEGGKDNASAQASATGQPDARTEDAAASSSKDAASNKGTAESSSNKPKTSTSKPVQSNQKQQKSGANGKGSSTKPMPKFNVTPNKEVASEAKKAKDSAKKRTNQNEPNEDD